MIKLNTTKIIQLNPKQGTKMTDNLLANMVKKITENASNLMSDTYYYRPINESFIHNNKDYKAIALSISQDEDRFSGHMLEICVLDSKMKEHKRPLIYGNKETLLKYLQDNNAVNNIKQDLDAILEEIKHN